MAHSRKHELAPMETIKDLPESQGARMPVLSPVRERRGAE